MSLTWTSQRTAPVYGIELLNANEQLRATDEGKLVLVDEAAGKEIALPLSLE